ncbi:hypothetical protein CLV37_10410 [Kineococcus rhizosphaerae]|uniref:Uncharacterized protein n=1 Tax=Kineococcus rhizosphaerae TaxID=559628 RepID=A0A2T0R4V9_9ACTN|nr:hypothetical protein CLV37_10410 [Kineococcus rhizosphaerae]
MLAARAMEEITSRAAATQSDAVAATAAISQLSEVTAIHPGPGKYPTGLLIAHGDVDRCVQRRKRSETASMVTA